MEDNHVQSWMLIMEMIMEVTHREYNSCEPWKIMDNHQP